MNWECQMGYGKGGKYSGANLYGEVWHQELQLM